MKYTLKSFEEKLNKLFPYNHVEVLEYNGTNKDIKYRCLDCGKIYEKNRASHLYENKTLCQKCYTSRDSKIRNWILDFIKNSSQFNFAEPWNNSVTVNIKLHCNNCDRVFEKQPSNLYKKQENTICPYCGDNGAPVLLEDYIESLPKDKQEDYDILKYTSKGKSVTFRHKKCGYVFSQLGLNFYKSKGCPKCYSTKSKGEIKIETFLREHAIKYEEEKSFKDLPKHYFDFYLPNFNCLIEYQGEQHYFPVNIYGGEEKFKIQIKRDEEKRIFAKEKNFNYIEIPYTDYNFLEEKYLIPLLGSTTNPLDVASSEAKEKTSLIEDNIV